MKMKTIGKRIRECRQKSGLSQKNLADLLKIKYQSVQDWERDRTNPSTGKIEKLCNIFNVTATWLILKEDSNYTDKNGVKEFHAPYTKQPKNNKCIKIFEQLKPETQNIVIKLMEALLLKDKTG